MEDQSFISQLFSASTKVSSMRFVFIIGVFFIMLTWASSVFVMIFLFIFHLKEVPGAIGALAADIGAVSAGAIGIIGSLAGFKSQQTKFESASNALPVTNTIQQPTNITQQGNLNGTRY